MNYYGKYNAVANYMNANNLDLEQIYEEIQNKTCKLSSSVRHYVVSHFDKEGEFIKVEE